MNNKIVIFSAFYEPHYGGVERYVKELSSALTEKGFEIYIVTSDTHNMGFINKYHNITVFRLKHKFVIDGRLPVPYCIRELKSLKSQIKAFSPDLIILNMRIYPICLLGAKLSSSLNIKSILIDHVSGYFYFDSKIKSLLSKIYEKVFTAYLKKKTDSFFGVSMKVNEWLKTFDIDAKGVIHNGVNENPATDSIEHIISKYQIKQAGVKILYAGRLLKEKGLLQLSEAYHKFRKQDTQLIICGDGPLLDTLKTQYPHDDYIFTGQISHTEVMTLLKFADIVVIPSYYPEGLPTLIPEAGISNCCVITTDSGGALELIEHKKNGLIIAKRSCEEIEGAMELLYNDRQLMKKLSQNLQQTVSEGFTWNIISDKLIKYYIKS